MKKTIWATLAVLLIFILLPGSSLCDTIRVDSVIVTAQTWEEAERAAKSEAVKRALEMLGNQNIPSGIREKVMSRADDLVTIRQALNKNKNKGVYTPVFFCNVDGSAISAIIEKDRKPTFSAMKRPQINIAVIFQLLPSRFEREKPFFLDRINNLLEEYFGKEGFQIGMPPSRMISRLDQEDRQKVFSAFVRYSTSVNYLLYGTMTLMDEDISAQDQGRYYKTRVGLTLRFFSIASGDHVSFSRDVYGVGDNEKASIVEAMRNCAKVITEKVGAHRVLEDWKRKLREGFEYDLMFCSFQNDSWVRKLRRELKSKGTFVAKDRGDNVTDIYRYRANPGEFVFPSVDFEDFLMDLPDFDMVDSDVILNNERLFFVFGDDEMCFDIGFDASENTRQVTGE